MFICIKSITVLCKNKKENKLILFYSIQCPIYLPVAEFERLAKTISDKIKKKLPQCISHNLFAIFMCCQFHCVPVT